MIDREYEFHIDNVDFHCQGHHWWACGPSQRFINPLDIVCDAYVEALKQIKALKAELNLIKNLPRGDEFPEVKDQGEMPYPKKLTAEGRVRLLDGIGKLAASGGDSTLVANILLVMLEGLP